MNKLISEETKKTHKLIQKNLPVEFLLQAGF